MDKIKVSSEIVPKLREWFTSGRGVKVWRNQEIGGSAAHEVFTPADVIQAPNWRYGDARIVEAGDLIVETFTPIASFRGRYKRMYWGPWVSAATEAKAKALCAKHGLPDTSWRWEYEYPSLANVTVGKFVESTFIVEGV